MAFRLVRLRRFCNHGVAAVLLILTGAFQSCAFFSGKPPLPKQASLEHSAKPPSATDFAALVADADVIYFPGDRAASGARSEPAALLLEALQQTGKPIAIGWDLIDASQQPLLDELQLAPTGGREELIARLELVGTGRAREHCRSVLRDAPPGIRQLALRCPAVLIVKLALGEMPTPDEEKQWPRGYRAPEGGLESYLERVSPKRGLNDGKLAESYRAQMLSQQFTAEKIVRHFRAVGGDNKLLVFLGRPDLEDGHGVPTYVAQKLPLRQLVLGSDVPKQARAKLLTRRSGSNGSRFKIVDDSPVAARD